MKDSYADSLSKIIANTLPDGVGFVLILAEPMNDQGKREISFNSNIVACDAVRLLEKQIIALKNYHESSINQRGGLN